jgi:hypothetical protein
MTMLSTKNYSIEDLPVTVKALTQEEACIVQGGGADPNLGPKLGFLGVAAGLLYESITDYENAKLTKVGNAIGEAACKLFNCNQ